METLPACLLPPFPPSLEAPVQLEGTNLSLATEVLPAPPPLISASNTRKPSDNTRRRALPSYLPSTDPGSTYNSGTGVKVIDHVVADSDGDGERGSKRKRQRTELAEGSRPKKPVAPRITILTSSVAHPSGLSDPNVPTQLGSTAGPTQAGGPLPKLSPPLSTLDPDNITAPPIGARSRRESSLLASSRLSQLDWTISGNARRKDRENSANTTPIDASASDIPGESLGEGVHPRDYNGGKGKGKEKENPDYHVNSKFCSTCTLSLVYSLSPGPVLYCDGCPRSFHLSCLEPPIEVENLTKGEWYCIKCQLDKGVPYSLTASPSANGLLSELINKVSTDLPSIFSLPEDMRHYFRDVGTSSLGEYLDTGELKVSKSHRAGIIEDRDPYRLKDRQNGFILCYRCGQSAAPPHGHGSSQELGAGADLRLGPSKPFSAIREDGSNARSMDTSYNDNSGRGGSSTVMAITADYPFSGLPAEQPPSVSTSPSPAPSQSQSSSSSRAKPRRSQPPATSSSAGRRLSARLVNKRSSISTQSSSTPQPETIQVKLEPNTDPFPLDTTSYHEADSQKDLQSIYGPGIKLGVRNTWSGLRPIISCDYCSLSWHLDCLNPPLAGMPPPHKKWMCPNHADHAFSKGRVPRHVKTVTLPLPSTSATQTGRRHTNGIVDIIPAADDLVGGPSTFVKSSGHGSLGDALVNKFKKRKTSIPAKRSSFEDVFINGIKYRLPEQTVRLDFWTSTVTKRHPESRLSSGSNAASTGRRAETVRERALRTFSSSTSLSSLSSSLESEDDDMPLKPTRQADAESMMTHAADVLLSLRAPPCSHITKAVQTDSSTLHLRNSNSQTSSSIEELLKIALNPIPPKQSHGLAPSPSIISSPNGKSPSLKIRIRMPGSSAQPSTSLSTSTPARQNPTRSPNPQTSPKPAGIRRSLRNRESASSGLPSDTIRANETVPAGWPSSSQDAKPVTSTPGQVPPWSPGKDVKMASGMSDEELKQLLTVRELMMVKGRTAMLEFLRS